MIILHNSCAKYNLLSDSRLYGRDEFFKRICNTFAFRYSELFGGAMWFVPVYVFTMTLSVMIIYMIYEKMQSDNGKAGVSDKMIKCIIALIAAIIGAAGIFLQKLILHQSGF